MSNTQWKPVNPAIVEAAQQARERGLSLRAVAADLAAKGHLSPSGRPYLPGSIASMLRPRDYVDAAPPAAVDDPDTKIDVADDFEVQLGVADVDAVPTLHAAVVDAAPGNPRWEPKRGTQGLIDFRGLMQRLCEFPHLQGAAMASVNLSIEQMGVLADRGDWREIVANWLSLNT